MNKKLPAKKLPVLPRPSLFDDVVGGWISVDDPMSHIDSVPDVLPDRTRGIAVHNGHFAGVTGSDHDSPLHYGYPRLIAVPTRNCEALWYLFRCKGCKDFLRIDVIDP